MSLNTPACCWTYVIGISSTTVQKMNSQGSPEPAVATARDSLLLQYYQSSIPRSSFQKCVFLFPISHVLRLYLVFPCFYLKDPRKMFLLSLIPFLVVVSVLSKTRFLVQDRVKRWWKCRRCSDFTVMAWKIVWNIFCSAFFGNTASPHGSLSHFVHIHSLQAQNSELIFRKFPCTSQSNMKN
jgi:hypothetical protein